MQSHPHLHSTRRCHGQSLGGSIRVAHPEPDRNLAKPRFLDTSPAWQDEPSRKFFRFGNQTLSTLWHLKLTSWFCGLQLSMASKAQEIPVAGQQARLTASAVERFVSLGVVVLVVAAIAWGWLNRRSIPFDPEHGLGYMLGIVGGIMMLVLLGYPLRKRARPGARAPGSVGFWFRFHMLLGLMGPLAILYHSRFSWGALNSAVALGAMVVVASSGLIGRFFYARVHRGYSGRKLGLRALKQDMDGLLILLEARGISREEIISGIQPFEDRAIAAGSAFWSSAGAVVGLSLQTRTAERRLRRRLTGSDRKTVAARALLRDYFQAVRRAAEFAFYDRLLRLWHLLHLPLFILLVAAAVLHIVAVHMY